MEEKKKVKISLGTVICIVIIVLLIAALGAVYYFGVVKNNDEIKSLNKKIEKAKDENESLNKENTMLNEQILDFQLSNELKKEEQEDEDNKQEIINLIKECEEKTNQKGIAYEIRVASIEKNDEDKFLVIANYNEPIEITKDQYENLIVSGSCDTFLEKTGTYNRSSKIFGEGSGYGFITIEDEEIGSVDYEIVKTDTGYSFRAPAGPGYPLTIQTEIKFYLEGKTKIYIQNEGDSNLKEYYEELNQKLTSNEKPIVTVEYKDEEIYLIESAK